MPSEIERKYLVTGSDYKRLARGTLYRQGYLCTDKERSVRIRVAGDRGYITIKGDSRGAIRSEFEYPVPAPEAGEMLDSLCLKPLIEKIRYRIPLEGVVWEVDEFLGENEGLVIAEVELDSERQLFDKPRWVGEEITGDARYYNVNLVSHPYTKWKKDRAGGL